MVGEKFHSLTVLRKATAEELEGKRRKDYWLCQCECGKPPKLILGYNLKNGNTKSCGCGQGKSLSKIIDIKGQTFGELTVVEMTDQRSRGKDNTGHVMWKCNCSCGKQDILVSSYNLRTGHTKSCGHLIGKTQTVRDSIIGKTFGQCKVESLNLNEKDPFGHASFNVLCNCGNTFVVKGDYLQRGFVKGCEKCFPKEKGSFAEAELRAWLQTYFNYKLNTNKTILDKKHIDIWIPNNPSGYPIGIEYNGLYWHSTKVREDTQYHLKKTQLAESKGIHLIQIFEDEWIYNKDIVKTKILAALGLLNLPIVGARKCNLKLVNIAEKNSFLDNYHIQGADKSRYKLGLSLKDELVALMTISYNQKTNEHEITRFATTNNYHIPGAFSKLLKEAIKRYDPRVINSFADRRWSYRLKNVYLSNGFVEQHCTTANYWYVDRNIRIHRRNFQLEKLKELFPELYKEGKTEEEIMSQTKYIRVYDSGNIKYQLTLKNPL